MLTARAKLTTTEAPVDPVRRHRLILQVQAGFWSRSRSIVEPAHPCRNCRPLLRRLRKEDDRFLLSRRIVFSRTDLMPHRQFIYDKTGKLLTDVSYESFSDFGGGVFLPKTITIERPVEEYEIILSVGKSRLNEPLKDDQFVLNQPPGSQLINLDDKNRTTSAESLVGKDKSKPNQ